MNFPRNPRARSYSAGVLGKDRGGGKPDGDWYFNDSRYSPAVKPAGSNHNRRWNPVGDIEKQERKNAIEGLLD